MKYCLDLLKNLEIYFIAFQDEVALVILFHNEISSVYKFSSD